MGTGSPTWQRLPKRSRGFSFRLAGSLLLKKAGGAILPEGDGGSRVEAGRCKGGAAPVGQE